MPFLTDDSRFNIIDLLLVRHVKNGFGNKVAIIDENNTITFNDLLMAIKNFPSCISEFEKIQTQSIVSCVFDDSIESSICFLSMIYYGLIPCFINPNLSTLTYNFYLKNISTKHILTEIKYVENAKKYVSENDASYTIVGDCLKGNLNRSFEFQAPESHPASLLSPLFCAYTSGTTGHPSAILHRHQDVKIMNENYAKSILRVNREDRLFTTSKMFFVYGLNSLFIALYHGATAILSTKDNDPDTIWDTLKKHRTSIFFSVPSIYSKLLVEGASEKINIKNCVSAGENLPEKIFLNWERKFDIRIIDGVGSTETLSTFISNVPEEPIQKCTGVPVKGFQCVLKDQEGNSVDDYCMGVLWVKGDTYPTRYINNEPASRERFIDGWFNTNDMFYKDKGGYFYYQGRLNDLIYKNGIWVFPSRIEERLNAHVNVIESVVLGERTENLETNLIAFLVVNDSADLDKIHHELYQLNEKSVYFQKEERLNFICIIDKMPKTCTGKVKRHELRKYKTHGVLKKWMLNKNSNILTIDMGDD